MSFYASMESICSWGYVIVGRRRLSGMVAFTLLLACVVLTTVFRSYHSTPSQSRAMTNTESTVSKMHPSEVTDTAVILATARPSRRPTSPPSLRPTRYPTNRPTMFPPETIDEGPLKSFLEIIKLPPYYLPKRTQNASVRVLFAMGLEGTGHHSLSSLLGPCLEGGRCRHVEDVSLTLFAKHGDGGLFASHKPNFLYSDNLYNHFLKTLLKTAANITQTGGEHLYILGLDQPSDAGMMSYPNFGRGMKVLNTPDLPPIVFLADHEAKLDVRVLVLLRDAESILRSVYGRNIGGEAEARILVNQAGVMFSQLAMLDPQYYICIYPKAIEDQSLRDKGSFQQFVHPAITKEEWKQMGDELQESRRQYLEEKKQRQVGTGSLVAQNKPPFSQFDKQRLDLYLQQIRSLCMKHDRLIV